MRRVAPVLALIPLLTAPAISGPLPAPAEWIGHAGDRHDGNAAAREGRFRDAVPLLRAAVAAAERLHGPDSMQAASTAQNLAVALVQLGDSDAALGLFRRCLAAAEKHHGADHPETADVLH